MTKAIYEFLDREQLPAFTPLEGRIEMTLIKHIHIDEKGPINDEDFREVAGYGCFDLMVRPVYSSRERCVDCPFEFRALISDHSHKIRNLRIEASQTDFAGIPL
ncbi:hypothetical protein [Fulvitalea axinellae]